MPSVQLHIISLEGTGFEYAGPLRQVRNGEYYLNTAQFPPKPDQWQAPFGTSQGTYFILRKAWSVPDFIPAGWWVYRSNKGTWLCSPEEPKWTEHKPDYIIGNPGKPTGAYYSSVAYPIGHFVWQQPDVSIADSKRQKEAVKPCP